MRTPVGGAIANSFSAGPMTLFHSGRSRRLMARESACRPVAWAIPLAHGGRPPPKKK